MQALMKQSQVREVSNGSHAHRTVWDRNDLKGHIIPVPLELTLPQVSVVSVLGVRLNVTEEADDHYLLKVSHQLEVNIYCSLFSSPPPSYVPFRADVCHQL